MGKRRKFDCIAIGGVMPPVEVSLWHDREKLLNSRSRPRVLMITNDPQSPKTTIAINVK